MNDIYIKYQAISRRTRTGPAGRLLAWIANYPIRTGILCGFAVVFLAAIRAHRGVLQEPLLAMAISVVVIFTWTILFYFMRSFFLQQTYFDVEVVREIIVDGDDFLWQEHGEVRKAISNPVIAAYTNPVPPEVLEGRRTKDLPWPVWVVIRGGEERFVLETKVTAGEASNYEAVPAAIANSVDENLPVHVASPLLMEVR